jgi:hypothetical protein
MVNTEKVSSVSWIKIGDCYPEEGIEVLIYHRGSVSVALWSEDERLNKPKWQLSIYAHDDEHEIPEPTYFALLPKFPVNAISHCASCPCNK